MTEKDKEIQELRRENSLLRRQRDLFKERMFSYARSKEKLESERGRLESEVETLQKDRETILDALDAAKADIEKPLCDSCIKHGSPKCTGADGQAVSCAAYVWRGEEWLY